MNYGNSIRQKNGSGLRNPSWENITMSRKNGIITRYDINKDGERKLISTVHHVCHVRQRPDLALSRTYKDYVTGEELPNLIPVCKACHNKLHPEKIFRETQSDHFMNTERWWLQIFVVVPPRPSTKHLFLARVKILSSHDLARRRLRWWTDEIIMLNMCFS